MHCCRNSALSCLFGFKKPDADQPIRTGKRKVIGYASGFVYGEVGTESQGLVITLVGATIIAAAITTAGIVIAQIYATERAAELEREKMAHDSRERALDRELEREKAGLPPKTDLKRTLSKTEPAKPLLKPDLKPIVSPEVTEDKFPPLNKNDVNAIPNGHWLEAGDDCKIVLDKSGLSQTWKSDEAQDADKRLPIDTGKGHLDYQNPLDTTNYKLAKVLSLRDFKKTQEELMQNDTCEVADSDKP